MLRIFSARSPLFLRVFLTGMSALAAVFFASAFSYARQAPAAAYTPASPLRPVSNTHRASVYRAPAFVAANKVTVLAGETLSGIAGGMCGTTADWTGFYAANRRVLANPDLIRAGQQLTINCADPGYTPPAPPPAPMQRQVQAPVQRQVQAPVQQSSGRVSTAGDSSFQACVISRESGGSSQVMNSTGHYGLYQFSASTWAAYGGNPADFGDASVAEQNRVFGNAMAAGGESNWAPYDGC